MKEKKRFFNTDKKISLVSLLVLLVMLALMNTGCAVHRYRQPYISDPSVLRTKTYYLTQEAFTLNDRFIIENENRRPVFVVNGKLISIGNKFTFKDMNGNQLAYIKQQIVNLFGAYKIYRDDRLVASIKRKVNLTRAKFSLKVENGDEYKIVGNYWEDQYQFKKNGKEVAVVSKHRLSYDDRYRVEIVEGEDDVLILSAVTIIDMVCHDDNEYDHNHSHSGPGLKIHLGGNHHH